MSIDAQVNLEILSVVRSVCLSFFRHETVNIHLRDKPDWFWKKNPLGAVPVLELDDKIVYESTATSEWLDDVYPEPRLQPTDPYRRAWDRILLEYFSKV